ncbi:hypothetical protein [Microvirga flavescens]|uniref:hypothetical protein n=1 Tax=Microvirga flavescens TaxID=2249811 RepID=UPI000DD9C537|nr:hypothetical protein [Microvirga flavescens]
MLNRLPLLISLLFAMSPAFADECPTAQSAKAGFILERQGILAEIKPADGFVHVVNTYPSGKKQDVISFRGLFEISRFDDTARSINIPLSDLRAIFPLDRKSRRVVTFAPAQPSKVGAVISLELSVSGEEKLQIGACGYNVLLVRNRYLNVEGKVISEHTDFYSPDLGFVLAKRYDEKGGRESMVKYQSIRPLGRMAPL